MTPFTFQTALAEFDRTHKVTQSFSHLHRCAQYGILSQRQLWNACDTLAAHIVLQNDAGSVDGVLEVLAAIIYLCNDFPYSDTDLLHAVASDKQASREMARWVRNVAAKLAHAEGDFAWFQQEVFGDSPAIVKRLLEVLEWFGRGAPGLVQGFGWGFGIPAERSGVDDEASTVGAVVLETRGYRMVVAGVDVMGNTMIRTVWNDVEPAEDE